MNESLKIFFYCFIAESNTKGVTYVSYPPPPTPTPRRRPEPQALEGQCWSPVTVTARTVLGTAHL